MQTLILRAFAPRAVVATPGALVTLASQALYWSSGLAFLDSWAPIVACFMTGTGLFMIWELVTRFRPQILNLVQPAQVPEQLPPPREVSPEAPFTVSMLMEWCNRQMPLRNWDLTDGEPINWLDVYNQAIASGIDCESCFSDFVAMYLPSVLELDRRRVLRASSTNDYFGTTRNRNEAGVYFTHKGLLRMCFQQPGSFDFIKSLKKFHHDDRA